MERMEGDSMSEHWESIIEIELAYYRNFPVFAAEIQQKLLENDLDIQVATTCINETGNLVSYCESTEQQAIKRVMKRDSLIKQLERANKRINRLFNAISKLSEEEQEVLDYLYIDIGHNLPYTHIARLLGYKDTRELLKARDSALKSVLKIYESERKQSEIDYKIERDKWRKEMASLIRASS